MASAVIEQPLPVGASRHTAPEGAAAAPAGEVPTRLRDAAVSLGFPRIGFAPVGRLEDGAARLGAWLGAGRHGEMDYLAGAPDRAEPASLLPGARTVIVVALPYPGPRLTPLRRKDGAPAGYVAAYARGDDYHDVLKAKLRRLADACAEIVARTVIARPCVDTAPLLERETAARAGVGFFGKSAMTILPGIGTYALLGELLVDVDLPAGAPLEPRCGQCTACLDACPTGAFVDAFVLDARRCISYLTIELRGAMPRELRPLVGTRVFGCDVCQQVCPFNAAAEHKPTAPELAPRPALEAPALVDLLGLGSSGHRRLVAGSALRRVSRARLARNAAVALGNAGDRIAVPALAHALTEDASPLVRGHAAWALGRLGGPDARRALERTVLQEADADVLAEAHAALADLDSPSSHEAPP